MSELTFREQAAIAFCASSTVIVSLEEIIETSQKLADAACKEWGHQEPISPAVVCPRCGGITSKHEGAR